MRSVPFRSHRTQDNRIRSLGKITLLAISTFFPMRAMAQDTGAHSGAEADTPVETSIPRVRIDPRDIVVFGNSSVPAVIKDFEAEDTYDLDRIAAYGVSSVGEVLDAINAENGDTEPQILVNGQPTRNVSDIADLPVEAIARIDALPRGAATRLGGSPTQRAYNVVLRKSVNTRTLTNTYQAATAGGWDNVRADGQVTYIKGQNRVNLSVKAGWSGALQEDERNVIPLTQPIAYSPLGNVLGLLSGGEIDPALSLAVGRRVTVAGIPVGNTAPGIASFAATADMANPSNLAHYRTLRGRSRPFEIGLTANKVLTPWLSVSFNGRLGHTADQRTNGLPTARFLLPASHPASPFSRNVVLALSDPARPLRSNGTGENASVGVTFNANFGEWRGTLSGKYDDRRRKSLYDTIGNIPGGLITIDNATNPFAIGVAARIPLITNTTWNSTTTRDVQGDAEGPLFTLPAGPLQARVGLGATWLGLDGASTNGIGDQHFRRHEYDLRGGLSIPLTAGGPIGHRGIGTSEITVDGSVSELGVFGTIHSVALGFNWQPISWLRLNLTQQSEELARSPQLLAAQITTIPNVLYFDPVTGDTVNVSVISGGAGNLDKERRKIRRVSINAAPWRAYNLQLSTDLIVTDNFNQAGPLPLPTPAVIAAFPDRFLRDAAGQLVLVDSRTVNFARQHTSELRSAVGFSIPLTHPAPPARAVAGVKRKAPARPILQVNASFTHVFSSNSTIRETLGQVDLLAGGAVGLSGGRNRDSVDASVALSDRGVGLRAQMAWRGPSYLITGTDLAPDRLKFNSYAKFDLKVFADLPRLLGASPLTRGARITFGIDNVTNARQSVRNQTGTAPLSYQPIYRDPLGRLISIEFRKTF